MSTMYEKIMGLPLMHGIGEAEVSRLAERVKLGFQRYGDGELICHAGEECQRVDFILQGGVKLVSKIFDGRATLRHCYGGDFALGADLLFGLQRHYSYDVMAAGDLSLMSISKKDYMQLLMTNQLYMLNYANHISRLAQYPRQIAGRVVRLSDAEQMAMLLSQTIYPGASDIEIEVGDGTNAKEIVAAMEEIVAKSAGRSLEIRKIGVNLWSVTILNLNFELL